MGMPELTAAEIIQAEWRKTIEDHFDVVKIQAMARIGVLVAAMPLENVLKKFDLGAVEHKGEDLARLDPAEALKGEIADSLCYVALAIHLGR